MALRARSRFSVALLTGALALSACGGDDAGSAADTTPDAGPTFAPPTTEEPSRIRQGSTTTAGFSLAFGEATTTTATKRTTTTTSTTTTQPEFVPDFVQPRPPATAPPPAPPVDQKADPGQTTTTLAPATTTTAPITTTTKAPATTTTQPATPAWCASAQKLTGAHPLDATSAGEVTSMRLSGPNEADWNNLNTFIAALQNDGAVKPDAATVTSGETLDALAISQCGGPFMDAWFTAFGGWPANS